MVFLFQKRMTPPHAVAIDGGPKPVIRALVAAMTNTLCYEQSESSPALPVIQLIVDSLDRHPDVVSRTYVEHGIQSGRRPIPLFLTARPARFQRRGLAWESEFLLDSRDLRLSELAARMRMLAHMWGDGFPIDIVRDAVVGSFRMMMELDADDYHHRSILIEDLQRLAEWDGTAEIPALRTATSSSWRRPLDDSHAYTKLFHDAYQQIGTDMDRLLATRAGLCLFSEDDRDPKEEDRLRDLANTVLRKVPTGSGRFVHAMPNARPQVLIIDDEAPEIVATLNKHRVGFEKNSASLEEIFHFAAERLTLNGDPPVPGHFPAEQWIRSRVTGTERPGMLKDIRCADLILLDLSLNQGQECELAGFVLLEKLRPAVPDIPLVIHTGSAALAHIIQAIRTGADWYVRKDAARAYSDLASILNDISRRPEWRKRSRRLKHERVVDGDGEFKNLQREEYLYIWRSLAADLPSGKLTIQPVTMGLSSAITCSVRVEGDVETSFYAKIDRPYVMVSERERFHRLVRPLIGNRAGRIESEVVYAGRHAAGLAYTLSGSSQGPRTRNEPLLSFISLLLDDKTATFTDVAQVFDELLSDLLQSLHQTRPSGKRREWMEPLFEESPTLRDSHELRLPPLVELELRAFGDPNFDATMGTVPTKVGAEVEMPLCRIEKSSADHVTVVFRDDATGFTHRARLRGEIAAFLARFRHLRPNRALSIRGTVLRDRRAFYDGIRSELGADVEALAQEHLMPFDHLDRLLALFDDVRPEIIGTIHGDLHLRNILIDFDHGSRAPVRGALWLIDFARTRRDSIAHDFAKLEVDFLTTFLGGCSGNPSTEKMTDLIMALDAGPLHVARTFDQVSQFVVDACQFIRRAATKAGVSRSEYLATVIMNHLTMLKVYEKNRYDDPALYAKTLQLRRRALAGAAATMTSLGLLAEERHASSSPKAAR